MFFFKHYYKTYRTFFTDDIKCIILFCQNIQIQKDQRKAIIKFKEASHAVNFQKKFQRYVFNMLGVCAFRSPTYKPKYILLVPFNALQL